jgi:hypothetical protein
MVTVSRTTSESFTYAQLGEHPFGSVVTAVTFTTAWSVTFRGALAGSDLALLTPVWEASGSGGAGAGGGCAVAGACEPFAGETTSDGNAPVVVDSRLSTAVAVSETVAGSFWPCAPFGEDGVARFPTLQVNEPGTHAIHFFFDRWQVDGPEFDVEVGPPVALALLQEPGTARGGVPFAAQPVVAVTDLGGNQVGLGGNWRKKDAKNGGEERERGRERL